MGNDTQLSGVGQMVLVLIGLVLFGGGGVVLAVRPAWAVSPVGVGAALIAAGLTLIITTIGRRQRAKREEVVVDERVTTISEKSGYRSFQVSFILQGGVYAVVGIAAVELPLVTVLGVLFGITGLTYIVSYNWYRRSM